MEERTQELRLALERSRAGRSRWQCPRGLRSEVVELVASRREGGEGLATVAADLGLSDSSLSRWIAAERSGSGANGRLREIRVAEPGPRPVGLSLVTPRGYRVEGLDTDSVLRLLREL